MSDDLTEGGLPKGEYSELCQTHRHYSNLRWLMMPVFMAVNAGLYEGARGQVAEASGVCDLRRWVPLVIAALFILFFRQMDAVLDDYIGVFVTYASEHFPTGHRAELERQFVLQPMRKRVRRLMDGFYFGWFVVWTLYVFAPVAVA